MLFISINNGQKLHLFTVNGFIFLGGFSRVPKEIG